MFPAVDFWNWGRTLINDFDKVLIFSAKAVGSFGKSTRIKTCAAQPFPYSALTSLTAVLLVHKREEILWNTARNIGRQNTQIRNYTNAQIQQPFRYSALDKFDSRAAVHKREEILWKTAKNIGRQNAGAQKQQQLFPAFQSFSAHTKEKLLRYPLWKSWTFILLNSKPCNFRQEMKWPGHVFLKLAWKSFHQWRTF